MARFRRFLRPIAALVALVVLAATLPACDSQFAGTRLRVAGGVHGGVYHRLAEALAGVWRTRLGSDHPAVLQTSGSPDNLRKLVSGEVDVAFSAADVASQHWPGPQQPRALARLHNDYLHIVVPQESPIAGLAGLAGKRVSVGGPDSGVAVIADRVLDVAGLSAPDALHREELDLGASIEALKANEIDAFFWSGGLPTGPITELAAVRAIRLLDLTPDLPALRKIYPVYNTATIPTSTYALPGRAVTTLSVPNYLLATGSMPADLAAALLDGLFAAHAELARANRAALSIDIHSAIETDPVPLHPGAARYYREHKK